MKNWTLLASLLALAFLAGCPNAQAESADAEPAGEKPACTS
jgi:hypothetical protein